MMKIRKIGYRLFKIEKTSLFLVEGKDECNFFDALLKYMKIIDVQIHDIGGKEKFKPAFSSLVKDTGLSKVKKLGFVRDAEENIAKNAFDSICKIIEDEGILQRKTCNIGKVENIEKTDGTGLLKVGIFIMPNNKDKGMLETLCLKSIKGMHCQQEMDAYMECLTKYYEQNSSFNFDKAKLLVYLASKVKITNSLGLGAKNGHFDFDDPAFEAIKLFLSDLFV